MNKYLKKLVARLRTIVAKELNKAIFKIDFNELLPIIDNISFSNKIKNIDKQLQIDALSSTAKYVASHMTQARQLSSKKEVLVFALKNVNVQNGLYCEFGVYKGDTINFIAKNINSNIHGFDSFKGLPEFWRNGFEKKTFKVESPESTKFEDNVLIHPGLFEDTLPLFTKNTQEPIAFMHIDCDLYTSTKSIFIHLKDRLVPGSVIVFDEYFNYPGWQMGEFKAFIEFITVEKREYQYLGYNKYDEQVVISLI